MDTISLSLKKENILKQPVFMQLNSDEIENLAALFTEKNFKAGETIVTEGDPVDSIYLIVEGNAEVQHVTIVDQKPVIQPLATLKNGDAIGLSETGFYSLSGIRTATVVAQSDCVTLFLSMPRFHGFALAYPHVNEILRKNSNESLDPDLNAF